MSEEEARARLQEMLREAGFDPDAPEPDTCGYRSYRDILLYGQHFDEVDPTTGATRCIPAGRMVIRHEGRP